jgi:hypothetical protein
MHVDELLVAVSQDHLLSMALNCFVRESMIAVDTRVGETSRLCCCPRNTDVNLVEIF